MQLNDVWSEEFNNKEMRYFGIQELRRETWELQEQLQFARIIWRQASLLKGRDLK